MSIMPPRFLGGALEEIKDQSVLVSLAEIKNPKFYQYLLVIIQELTKQNNKLTFLIVNHSSLSLNFLPRWFELKRSIRHRILFDLYRTKFLEQIKSHNIPFDTKTIELKLHKQRFNIKTIQDIIEHPDVEPECVRSLLSIASTHMTRSSYAKTRLSFFERRQVAHMISAFKEISQSLSVVVKDFESVIVLNGRMPEQAATTAAARLCGVKTYHFEHGGQIGRSFHFESFVPQDVSMLQQYFIKRYSEQFDSLFEIAHPAALRWMNKRIPNISRERSGINALSVRDIPVESSVALVCTSTLSEYTHYSSGTIPFAQHEMLCLCITKLQREGFSVIVRIHPNQMNSHWLDLGLLSRFTKVSGAVWIPPWDPTSSYELASNSDLVVVWDSTIGLETYFMGKPTYVLNRSFYSEVLNVPVISKESLTSPSPLFKRYSPDQKKAILATYLHMANGYSVDSQHFDSRDIEVLGHAIKQGHDELKQSIFPLKDSAIDRLGYWFFHRNIIRFPSHTFRFLSKVAGPRLANAMMKQILLLVSRRVSRG